MPAPLDPCHTCSTSLPYASRKSVLHARIQAGGGDNAEAGTEGFLDDRDDLRAELLGDPGPERLLQPDPGAEVRRWEDDLTPEEASIVGRIFGFLFDEFRVICKLEPCPNAENVEGFWLLSNQDSSAEEHGMPAFTDGSFFGRTSVKAAVMIWQNLLSYLRLRLNCYTFLDRWIFLRSRYKMEADRISRWEKWGTVNIGNAYLCP